MTRSASFAGGGIVGSGRRIAGRLRYSASLRTRLIYGLVLLTAFTLTITILVDYFVDRADYHDRVNGALDRGYAQVVTLAQNGVDPLTRQPFANAEALVRVAMQRLVSEPGQGFLGISDGQISWEAPETVETRLEDDEEFRLYALRAAASAADAVREDISTQTRDYRVLIIPVRGSGEQDRGAVVIAFDMTTPHFSLLRQHAWGALIGVVVLSLTGVVLWRGIGRILLPLSAARRTADEITGTDLSRRIPVHGDDDLAALVGTINDMLDRLEGAFAGQRRLLDDVSHELRTPLTIVQGNLELMDADDPEETAATRALVLDELARMNRLVGDLVTLAETDRPDFVRRAPTDLGELLDRVLEKALLLGNRDWRIEGHLHAVVSVDPQRITQALLQLAGNAVEHSEEGAVIAFGAREDETRGLVRIWVRDEGEGIPPEVQPRIFERFARVQPAERGGTLTRPRTGMGLGIGLSIVDSIASAHGGWVELNSALGRGSRFTLVLPGAGGTTPLERSPWT